MNTPSPLVPQGTFQDKGKSHVRITVFAILAIHFVLLGVLLIAGCNKKSASETDLAENPVPPVATPTTPEQWPTPAPPPTGAADIPPVPPPVAPAVQTQATAPIITPTPVQPTIEPTPIAPTPIVEPVPGLVEHTITKGETLATIGKKYGVGYKAIEAANPGISPTRLKIGDKIKIPAKTASTTAALATPNATDASAGKVYVVKSGDNLLKIAKSTGVSVNQLRAANNLRTDQIRVGQKLKIPVKAPPAQPVEAVSPPPVAPPVTPGVPQ
ncbi:MAG TPA: LysM peptidoglycan-binding domain-containing protein [Verrucomicrobiae bacterium]|nr:LysM peptidoglycan-binding domain-containing protein [Verrucomicrobiae bacterium]